MVHGLDADKPATEPGWWAHLGDTEPIRRALWPVAIATIALLGGYGVLTHEVSLLWLGLAAAVLGVGGGEVARSAAWAPGSVDERDLDWLEHLERWRTYEYERGLADGQGVGDDPGAHAAPEQPTAITRPAVEHPSTREITALRPSPPRMQ